MKKLGCPSCGAEVYFQTAMAVCAVCEYCRSLLVRRDVNLDLIGKVAALAEDTSQLQLGSEGVYDQRAFTLAGRVQVGWESGMWNEWFAMFQDGTAGWLAEAQGFYGVTFAVEGAPAPGHELSLGETYPIRGIAFEVEDIKEFHYLSCEGELPFPPEPGVTGTSIDLLGPDGACASIQYFKNQTFVFAGKYLDWEVFQFRNLRELEGW